MLISCFVNVFEKEFVGKMSSNYIIIIFLAYRLSVIIYSVIVHLFGKLSLPSCDRVIFFWCYFSTGATCNRTFNAITDCKFGSHDTEHYNK